MSIPVVLIVSQAGSNRITVLDGNGNRFVAHALAIGPGYMILNADFGDRRAAIRLTDLGEYCESREGETFREKYQRHYEVRRFGNASSFQWVELSPEDEHD